MRKRILRLSNAVATSCPALLRTEDANSCVFRSLLIKKMRMIIVIMLAGIGLKSGGPNILVPTCAGAVLAYIPKP